LAIAAVLALVLLPCAALARPLTDQERASLAATVESFEAAMREGNFTRVAQTVPPKVIGAIARRAGTTPDQIVASMIKAMQQTLQGGDTKIESFGMDLATANHKELASGEPYVLIPTQTIIAVGGRRFRERSHTLALLDEGKWFLLRINNARQIEILREVYPEFTSVEFPSGSTETLNP
jgi:hypothetical protein